MNEPLALDSYTRPPVITVAGGIALAIRLLKRTPHDASDGVKKRARALRAKTVALQEAWAARDRIERPTDKRPFDNANDVAWGALIDRLVAYAALPNERYPRAARASLLITTLKFGDRAWLNFEYDEQWAEGERRLRRIVDEGLRTDLASLSGEDFVAEVERTHREYGDALGITTALPPPPTTVALTALLRDLGRAISEYALQLLAMHDADDDANDRAVRLALAPLDEHRAKSKRSPKSATDEESDENVNPNTPVPVTD